ncbi:hypothetical protein C2G38_2235963 [Gigaspora rosea]|uniref:Uncharacterized protein n=1 Tax=Gigaspora rosea TaxID=44941 RepID=A0A397TPX6_9GLOM|nr:hypothetical protein C2G38_2235963 [Gigaspora rosea]
MGYINNDLPVLANFLYFICRIVGIAGFEVILYRRVIGAFDNKLEPKRGILTSLVVLRSKKGQVLADALCKIEE